MSMSARTTRRRPPIRIASRVLLEGLRKHCPGMIVQFSTGGRSGKGSERGGMLHLGCDMASLSTGSCNFPTIIYENHPDLVRELAEKMMQHDVKPEIEVFDLSMLYQALRMADEGLLKKPLHVQFVLGVKNAMPCIRQAFDFMVGRGPAPCARGHLGRSRHRQAPTGGQPLVPGTGRSLPDRARRQHPLGRDPAGCVQCGTGRPGCGALRRLRAPPGLGRGSPENPWIEACGLTANWLPATPEAGAFPPGCPFCYQDSIIQGVRSDEQATFPRCHRLGTVAQQS